MKRAHQRHTFLVGGTVGFAFGQVTIYSNIIVMVSVRENLGYKLERVGVIINYKTLN